MNRQCVTRKWLISSLRLALIAAMWFGLQKAATAEIKLKPSLHIDLTQTYPQHNLTASQFGWGTPIFYNTPDNQNLVLIFGTMALASNNQGATWQNWAPFSAWPHTTYQDVVRQGNNLWAFTQLNAPTYGTALWRSTDLGLNWTGGDRLTNDTDKWSATNQKVIMLDSSPHAGRLVVPVELALGTPGTGPDLVGTIYSDNGGQSWTRSPLIGPPPGVPTQPDGVAEPSVVELPDGRLSMIIRARGGYLAQSFSNDGGATWGAATQTELVSPLSPPSAKQIPGTDAQVVVWNYATPGTSTNWNDESNIWRPRSPLAYSISEDGAESWSTPTTIASGTAAYPSVYFFQNKMFVTYWEDPSSNALWGSPDTHPHLMLVAYDVVPEPSSLMLASTLGLLIVVQGLRRLQAIRASARQADCL